MKNISNYLLITIILVLTATVLSQNKLLVDLRKSKEVTVIQKDTVLVSDPLIVKRADSLQYLADSLYNENYPCQIELNRFEIAFRLFTKRNPKAAEEYGRIISNETE